MRAPEQQPQHDLFPVSAMSSGFDSEQHIAAACFALLDDTTTLSPAERQLGRDARGTPVDSHWIEAVRARISSGADPLGEGFASVRSAGQRRTAGAVYTPSPVVGSMIAWLSSQGMPARVVDPGAGSGRFIVAAGEAFPDAQLIAIEMDPLAALMLRANLSVRGWTDRATLWVRDYREVELAPCAGVTAFIGNPPYVRHHGIGERWKSWYAANFAKLGIRASALAGLHLHFFLKTRLLAQTGDIGAFITSAEWMDVNYGSALRRLLTDELGGIALHRLDATVEAFPGTATTAAITCFRVGETAKPLRTRCVASLESLNGLSRGTDVARERWRAASRWSALVSPSGRDTRATGGEIELGEMFRVHRGQVTGANKIWIAGEHAAGLPECVKLPAVTRAKDLLQAGASLHSAQTLRRVVDLPADLEDFTQEERNRISAFLSWAVRRGADQGYVARHRKAWWSVGLRSPAPILCTYMARRPPQFTRNACAARHINIAHGLYPREPLPDGAMTRLVTWLNANVDAHSGRTYAGGLTKFEPKEIERLRIPSLQTLLA